jgi:hypothetical protein
MDLRPRCSRCLFQLLDPRSPVCPFCQANVDEVGIWTELHEWAKTRQKGRARYVLMDGLAMLLLMILSAPVAYFIRGRFDAEEAVFFTGCHFLAGLVGGWLIWKSNKKQFALHRHLLEEQQEQEAPD